MISEELWKDIKGYEGYYQVSNFGRIRSIDRIVKDKTGKLVKKKGIILKQSPINKQGYLRVNLRKNGEIKTVMVHRIVAKHFVTGYKYGLDVDHIDTNKKNNSSYNLRWVTKSENMMNPITYSRNLEENKKKKKPLIGINLNNGFIVEFNCVLDAKKSGFKSVNDNIRGRTKKCKNYKFMFL